MLTQIFRPITHKVIDPDWLIRKFVLHVVKIIPKPSQLLGVAFISVS